MLENHLKSLIYRVSGVFISDKADIDKPWSSSIDVLKNRCSSSLSSDPPTLSTKMIFERVEKSVSVLVWQCAGKGATPPHIHGLCFDKEPLQIVSTQLDQ